VEAQSAVRGQGYVKALFLFLQMNTTPRREARQRGSDAQAIAGYKAGARHVEAPDETAVHRDANPIIVDYNRQHSLRSSFVHFRSIANYPARSLDDVYRAPDLKVADAEAGEHRRFPDSAAEVGFRVWGLDYGGGGGRLCR
jgi:hypothetical protein